jgi:hypothetical protein
MGAWEGIPIDRMEPAQKQTLELGRLIAVLPFREFMGVWWGSPSSCELGLKKGSEASKVRVPTKKIPL